MSNLDNPLYDIVTEEERTSGSLDEALVTNNQGYNIIVPANVADKVRKFTWTVGVRKSDNYHTINTGKNYNGVRYTISISHFLMGRIPKGFDVVDHINRNRLDNSWANLRFATYTTNNSNIAPRGSSLFYGVSKSKDKWIAVVRKTHYGVYSDQRHAAWMYNLVVKKYGYIMPLNDLEKPEGFNATVEQYEERGKKPRKQREKVIKLDIERNSEGIAIIPVRKDKWAKVDDIHYPFLMKYSWRQGEYYPKTNNKDVGTLNMHQMIYNEILHIEIPENHVIDHINRDPYDNRCLNLRIATNSANSQNCTRDVGLSGFIGVKQRGFESYRASILDGGVTRYLGTYYHPTTAAYAYDCAASQIHGVGARTNGVDKPSTHIWNSNTFELDQIDVVVLDSFERNKNGYKGVDFVYDAYRANIQVKEKTFWLGTFPKAEVAAYAYNCAAKQIHGKQAIINDVSEPTGYKWNSDKMILETSFTRQIRKVRCTSQSGFRGVTQRAEKFMAAIYIDKKRKHLGIYDTAELAAYAFNCACLQHSKGDDIKINDVQKPDSYEWDDKNLRLVKLG